MVVVDSGRQRWQASDGGSGVQWWQWHSMGAMMADCKVAARRRQGGGSKEEDTDTTIKRRQRRRRRLAAEVNEEEQY
jgi:hypothetical protein